MERLKDDTVVGLNRHNVREYREGVSKDLLREVERLEKEFTVDGAMLKKIVHRFGEELDEGLRRKEGSNIPMNVTWVHGFPTGKEQGTYLAIDMGGTNIRICQVTLSGNKTNEHEIKQHQFKMADEMKKGSAKELVSFIADSLQNFIEENGTKPPQGREKIPLGYTFSYPVTQNKIDHGVLQRWTKGIEITGAEGEDAAAQLRQAIEERKLPVELVCLINDTVGALIASAYNDSTTKIGGIFGTGCNAAYMETCQYIPKISHLNLPPDRPVAINCEYGAFDNALNVLPRTKYDDQVDAESPKPGEQSFEKMSAGLYLGEIFRLIIVDLAEQGLLFKDQDFSKLKEPYILDTGFLSAIENDDSKDLQDSADLFKKQLNITPSVPERHVCWRLAELIGLRGARLATCGVAALCKKKGIREAHVAADGSVVNKHPKFKKRWAHALGEILDFPEQKEGARDQEGNGDPVSLVSAEDGSGVGAAIIAAMTLERAREGK